MRPGFYRQAVAVPAPLPAPLAVLLLFASIFASICFNIMQKDSSPPLYPRPAASKPYAASPADALWRFKDARTQLRPYQIRGIPDVPFGGRGA